ncbi:MAG: protein translocase subunit SecF [candidate division Zixibacteria bacterium HGW-Zixibacteria-1]|nr:MAG: protein translocase subunit SecF [candidate division Zixibacteria bacterium HGW-Zixibacteria-1]
MFRIIKDTNIDFIGNRGKAFIFSVVLVLVGLFAFVMVVLDKANMGIDFSGGTMLQGNFENPINIGDLRGAVIAGGFPEASIQELDRTDVGVFNSYMIRVKETVAGEEKAVDRLLAIIKERFPDNKFQKDSEHTIGPAVGATLKRSAQWAVLISVLGMIAYIGLRFDFRSGVAATIATFHDVLAVLGIFYLMNKEITLLVVTALLTLAGYSLTDTVVVYDRIRENLKKFRKKGEFVTTVNNSINEVLSRTIMTSGTTFLVVLVLYLFGGEVVKDFALAMIIGIIIGTYSSIFVASPIVVEWEARSPKRFK